MEFRLRAFDSSRAPGGSSPRGLFVALHKQHDIALAHELVTPLDELLVSLFLLLLVLHVIRAGDVGRACTLGQLGGRGERGGLGGVGCEGGGEDGRLGA